MERCWAETYCKEFPNYCGEYCYGYRQLNDIYSLSRMPKKYQYPIQISPDKVDTAEFLRLKEYMNNVEDRVKDGVGIFIHSPTKGNGKTTWACKIMNEYLKKVVLDNNMRCRGLFINVPEFLETLKEGFDNKEVAEKMLDLKEDIREADLVIWDDIGTETPTNWVRQQLYTFINHRDGNGLANIYTSNISIKALSQDSYLGDRIVSRVHGQCREYLIQFEGIDMRINK